MTRTLSIDAVGARIDIDGSAVTDDAWVAVQTAWQDARADPATVSLPDATVHAHGSVSTRSMLAALSIDVTLAALRERAGDLLMLHAAGLAMPDGRVVVLVGPSGRGKTTASRVLGREFGYVSDEAVGIAADGAVFPYRKPLSLIEHGNHLKAQRSPKELGLRSLPAFPLRLAALVLLERDEESGHPRLERLDLAEGIVGLAGQASYLGRIAQPLLAIKAHVDAVGGVYRIVYREVSTLAPLLLQLATGVHRPIPQVHPWESPIPPEYAKRHPSPDSAEPAYRRVDALDALALEDGRLLLLLRLGEYSTKVFVLDGIAPTIWNNLARPLTLSELVIATVRAHGLPPAQDAAASLSAVLDRLTEAGILARV